MPLLPIDSFLRMPPAGLVERDRVWIEGAGFSITIAGLAYARLCGILEMIGESGTLSKEEDAHAWAFADAWTYVDSAHRLSDLLDAGMRGVGTKELARLGKEFQGISRPLLELRNCVQHVTDEFANLAGSGVPLWGSVVGSRHRDRTAGTDSHAGTRSERWRSEGRKSVRESAWLAI